MRQQNHTTTHRSKALNLFPKSKYQSNFVKPIWFAASTLPSVAAVLAEDVGGHRLVRTSGLQLAVGTLVARAPPASEHLCWDPEGGGLSFIN